MLNVARATAIVFLLGPWVVGCAARQPIVGQETTDLDRKLSTFAYIEEGKLVTFVIGTHAARDRDGTAFMPVEIAVANNGLRELVLLRESFTLVDEEGTRYPVATPEELMQGYEFLDLDRDQLAELYGITVDKFSVYRRYPSKFSPTRLAPRTPTASTTVRERVALPKFGYLVDYLYFPKPATGIRGHRFELFLDSESLDDPVFVRFEVR